MKARPLADLLLLFVGPAVWFAHFTILYGAEALICTPPVTTAGAMTWIGIAATLVALAILTVFAAMLVRSGHLAGERGEQSSPAFLHGVALLLALLSALGAIWTAFPIALLRVCASTGG